MRYQQELHEFIAERGLTQAALARAIGVSAAAVNQYLQGKYAGDAAALEVKAAAWLARQRDKIKQPKLHIAYVPTETARQAQGLLKMAHQYGEAVVLYGQAGLGKTQALKEYRNQYMVLRKWLAMRNYMVKCGCAELCEWMAV